MRLRRSITLIIAVLLVALLAFDGCGGEPRVESTPAKRACIELMQKVPVYYEDFEFWDVRALQSDPDLGEFYKVWHERRVGSLEERFGIKSSVLNIWLRGDCLT